MFFGFFCLIRRQRDKEPFVMREKKWKKRLRSEMFGLYSLPKLNVSLMRGGNSRAIYGGSDPSVTRLQLLLTLSSSWLSYFTISLKICSSLQFYFYYYSISYIFNIFLVFSSIEKDQKIEKEKISKKKETRQTRGIFFRLTQTEIFVNIFAFI